ncbi:MAG: hypothetical protein R6T91_03010 [Bacteroidales bacterium]
MKKDGFYKQRIAVIILLCMAVAVTLMHRFFVLKYFSSVYTDHDQVLMWLGASDYKELLFYEPCFYGQNYNVMIEALLAVPLLFFGVPHHYALPLATSFLFLFPVFLISFFSFRKRWYLTAFFSAVIPLAMPLRFHMISSMPRGFISGPAIAAIAMIIVLAGESQWRFFWFGLLGVLSVVILPSAALIMIPVGLYVLLTHWRELRNMALLMGGGAIGGIFYILKNSFYALNPHYNHYSRIDGALYFSIDNFLYNLKNYENYFSDVTPILFNDYYALQVVFVLLFSYIMIKSKLYIRYFIFIISLIFIFLTLGFEKISDGTVSIFYPYSRYYFSIFYLMIFFVWLIDKKKSNLLNYKKNIVIFFIVFASLLSTMVINTTSGNYQINVKEEISLQRGVFVGSTVNIYKDSEKLKSVAEQFDAELIIGNSFLLNYAFPALYREATPTLLLPAGRERLERRTWRIAEEFEAIRKRIILINYKNTYDESHIYPFHKVIHTDHLSDSTIYVIENARSYTTKQYLYSLGQDLTF